MSNGNTGGGKVKSGSSATGKGDSDLKFGSQAATGARAAKTQERKRLIVETAALLFIEKGFHQTGMRDIASRAGISLGNLYNHFSGKDELISAIAGLEAQELVPILALLDQTGEDVLGCFAASYLDYCARPENAALTAEITAEVFRNPSLEAEFQGTRQRLVSGLARHLQSKGTDCHEEAHLLLILIEGAGMRAVGLGDDGRKSLKQALLQFIHITEKPS